MTTTTTKRELLDQLIDKLVKYCEDEKIPFHTTLKRLRSQFKTEEIAGVIDDHYSKAHENKELKEFLKFEIENNKKMGELLEADKYKDYTLKDDHLEKIHTYMCNFLIILKS